MNYFESQQRASKEACVLALGNEPKSQGEELAGELEVVSGKETHPRSAVPENKQNLSSDHQWKPTLQGEPNFPIKPSHRHEIK